MTFFTIVALIAVTTPANAAGDCCGIVIYSGGTCPDGKALVDDTGTLVGVVPPLRTVIDLCCAPAEAEAVAAGQSLKVEDLDFDDLDMCPEVATTSESTAPTVGACDQDVQECPDGTFVGRDPADNCEFKPCRTDCTQDVQECSDGSFVGRDPALNCEFEPCPDVPGDCAADVQGCPDGTFVSRDPANNCEFEPCPEVSSPSSAAVVKAVVGMLVATVATLQIVM